MQPSTLTTAIAALEALRDELGQMLSYPLNTMAENAAFEKELADVEVAIADLEAIRQAPTAALIAAAPDLLAVCEAFIDRGVYNDQMIYAVRKAKGNDNDNA